MIKVFISHKKEDSYIASRIANELNAMEIPHLMHVTGQDAWEKIQQLSALP